MRPKDRRSPSVPVLIALLAALITAVLSSPEGQQQEQASEASGIVPANNLWSARLRHQRHLLDKTPLAEPYISNDYTTNPFQDNRGSGPKLGLTVQDNHKPVFTNCLNYQPSVKEEQPTNTYVFTVKAFDKDPPDNGGTITYTFVSAPGERPKFSIDAQTGEITTRHMFDRDEPTREKEVYLSVRATDNGKPHLDDVCTIKVTIQDENDNSPVFDKVVYRGFNYKNYVESVPQDLLSKSEVMRISATDIDDGINSAIQYDLSPRMPQDSNYFRIDQNTGVIYLDRTIDRDPGYKFKMRATATDQGVVPKSATMDLEILVVESHKKAPTFISVQPDETIYLPENLTNFSFDIATIIAASNTDEKSPVFELVPGRTEQSNKLNTFRLESEGNTAHIRLSRHMDYESISEYILNIRIQNKHNLAAEHQLNIQVEDVNDNIPVFTEVVSGSVLENEPAGTAVMQVRAIDADSSMANNRVTYELADNREYFAIDPYTGNITTLVMFDREKQDVYNVKVIATDNAPSALYSTGEHNKGEQVFRIEIADKNDHPPHFTQSVYEAEEIPEDANLNALVTEVKALDDDTASPVTYSIVDGNIYNAFLIENTTGKIKVNSQLDYENITDYVLKVRAFDGAYEDYCTVEIKISNVNDNPPVFQPYEGNITITEEELVPGCITTLEAYDPDIQDRSMDQRIVYSVVKDDQRKLMTINKNGCLSLIKPLDRDPPNGYATWQVIIQASDEGGGPKSLQQTTEVIIALRDINDNAPYLDMPQPVVWRENQLSGTITRLSAKDNDGPENGAPFEFFISSDASYEIKTKFGISGVELQALTTFDREEKKFYNIPITITDSGIPSLTGTSTLQVVIGDENDNPMKPGRSSIFVYTYKGESPDMEIGRVYVDDLDDWDLPDKKFKWLHGPHERFDLKSETGMITMLQNTKEQTFVLEFEITEQGTKIAKHTVNSTVVVTVKEIPEEAVDKSGSVRLAGISAEEFITPGPDNVSKATILKKRLASILNATVENVDVFTILHSPHNPNTTQLDVRFSAHGSPYYQPERINAAIDKHQAELEKELGVTFLMVNIDECLVEKLYCESSCTNFLNKSNEPAAVYTNTTSFVGIRAVIDPFCQCEQRATTKITCHNGGSPTSDGSGCQCPAGFEGPRCEILSIGFYGDGYALYPSLQSCMESHMSLEVRTSADNGLLFYAGPSSVKPSPLSVQDFMSLELKDGFPVLLVDYGSGTLKIGQKQIKISDGEPHRIEIIWTKTSIEMKVDSCNLPSCLSLSPPIGINEYLNVNGPLQLGGSFVDLRAIASTRNWTHKPFSNGFNGCIRNLTFNGHLYNLGAPSMSRNVDFSCTHGTAVAVSFGIDASFLIAIFVCLAVLLILLLAVVVHRRKSDDLYKDTDDIRENIINYEDEGGGEGDMTGYDLNVLRLMYDGSEPVQGFDDAGNLLQKRAPDEVPDICGFLGDKLNSVDNDPDLGPYDDVRNYMYEGEGNSVGSLSSLASGTDDGDLNFDYLSNFGPRFRKLADMYGEDPSDEESETYRNTHPESWC
ncbi:DE-cadherin isoform X1 [Melanaphis sacchari]|uniref:DE-cadherin isoform X1 n=1 Tax=Melanaphis sacchari TaxID=742174 RepID=UPI000DC1434B|nr:DE-cadherin isoform X1 [Melanaphis sacchari]